MFETWLEQEERTAKEKCRMARIVRILYIVLMIPIALTQLFLLLDGPGDFYIVSIGFLIFIIVAGWFVFSLGSYKKAFINPLLASVERELPTDAEKQEFARQMQSNPAHIVYAPNPQWKTCDMLVTADYCYCRQPRKSRIIRNREIRKVLLAPDDYTVGRGHMRQCYRLDVFIADNEEKPAWRAYFLREDELYAASTKLQEGLPTEAVIQDDVVYGKTEEGRKEARKKALIQALIAFAFVAVMIALAKLIQ